MRGRGASVSLSNIHAKGLLTMCFLLLAESVSLTNAVTFWNTYQTWSHEQRGRQEEGGFARAARHAQECRTTAPGNAARPPDNTCSPNLPPAKLHYRSRIAKRTSTVPKTPEECCTECSSCSEAVMKTCGIPRGGHGVHAATEKVADTVVQAAKHGPAPYGIPFNAWKVIFQAFLTALNVFCWLIPLRSKKMSENKLALSLANAFSGGVFLTLAFGHLIPECVDGFHGYNEVTPYMLVLGGYLLIFFVEKVAFDAHEILHAAEHEDDHKHDSSNGHSHAAPAPVSGRSAVILLGALAVHSILEMMALGLADSFGDCAILTLSISLHQPAESIALLVAFLKSGMPKGDIIRFLSVFSCMGPIGVAIGMAVNEFAAPIVDSIMLAIVAGTFVYVGATEVIPEEFEHPQNKWKKFAALMSGIVSIFFITQYTMSLEIH
jgi:zinc transporter 1/2/3